VRISSSEDEKLRRFAANYRGKQKAEMIAIVAKGRQFAGVLKTPVGHEILEDAQAQWAFNLTRIINGEATEEDRVRFTVLDSILSTWSKKIQAYYEAQGNMDLYLKDLEG
jgi:hypothetical protein